MRLRQWLLRVLGRGAKRARRVAREVGPACRRLADRLAYRPRELVVVALLAGGLSGGVVVERWRARHPAAAERLEAEPPRPAIGAAALATPAPRPRPLVPRCEAPGGRARRDPWPADPPRAVGLDLNRATPGELARLAGISWGLAARIVAARDAGERGGPGATTSQTWGGRVASGRRWPAIAPAGPVDPEPAPSTPAEAEPADGSSDASSP